MDQSMSSSHRLRSPQTRARPAGDPTRVPPSLINARVRSHVGRSSHAGEQDYFTTTARHAHLAALLISPHVLNVCFDRCRNAHPSASTQTLTRAHEHTVSNCQAAPHVPAQARRADSRSAWRRARQQIETTRARSSWNRVAASIDAVVRERVGSRPFDACDYARKWPSASAGCPITKQ